MKVRFFALEPMEEESDCSDLTNFIMFPNQPEYVTLHIAKAMQELFTDIFKGYVDQVFHQTIAPSEIQK